MDILHLPIPLIILIVVVIVTGGMYFIEIMEKAKLYPDLNGLDIGLRDFKLNAPWWSDKASSNMEHFPDLAQRDYAVFCATGTKSLLMHPKSVVHYSNKDGSSVSAPVGTDNSYI